MSGAAQVLYIGDFIYHGNCWKGNRSGHKQFRRILECGDDSDHASD